MPELIGPVILDLIGPELSQEECDILQHPLVGGIIFFSRNYESPEQITELCRQVRHARTKPLLITVDHEGGKVQRFRDGFTAIPAMGELGELYDHAPQQALTLAEHCGWMMASELLAVGVDLSFAPVLDLNKQLNPVTDHGRPFHREPQIVIALAKAAISGMRKAGMAATGKHFPGHGSVNLDSHLAMPIDQHDFKTIAADDLIPFAELIRHGIDAIMPAHIVFPNMDDKPVGFSSHWLKTILRQQLQFSGIIFSDDLNMKGAGITVNYAGRAQTALEAGCDMVLVCNNREGAIQVLDQLPHTHLFEYAKIKNLQGKRSHSFAGLKASTQWQQCHEFLSQNRKSV